MPTSDEILGPNGLLSKEIPGFLVRDAQLSMANAIEKAIQLKSELVIEAGTGTGKTFGYLVPIFLSKQKAIIATATKTLQDQIFFKDIPILKKLFTHPSRVMLLKGRANYLCLYRLERTLDEGRLQSRQLVTELQLIKEWSTQTNTGDINECHLVPEDSMIWREVTSTPDNCLNQDCEFYKECYVVKVRQEALLADILIINHHLFFADLALQEEGFGELLPGVATIIFDEAHHLSEIASQFFSTIISSKQLLELTRDCENEVLQHAKDLDVSTINTHLRHSVQDMRAIFGLQIMRFPWPNQLSQKLKENIELVKDNLKAIEQILKEAAPRAKSLEGLWRRCVKLLERFHLLTSETPANTVHWYETYTQSFTIHHTPLIIGDLFKAYLKNHKRTWVFTSATLTVKNSFKLFVETLGLENTIKIQLNSPFNYQTQALLYVPRALPDPHHEAYNDALVETIIPIIEASKGKTFLLFTSYKSLDYVANILPAKIIYPVLLQGSKPKRQLIEEFKHLGNAVLLGTNSFWHGVDVRGDALSCVIIDKLPFASPSDPILQAKLNLLKKQGKDPFQEYQLPNAVLLLKQGAGRLIRDAHDRGILVVCDPRLVGARYGEVFLQSLPLMPRTRDINKVFQFF